MGSVVLWGALVFVVVLLPGRGGVLAFQVKVQGSIYWGTSSGLCTEIHRNITEMLQSYFMKYVVSPPPPCPGTGVG